MDAAVSFARTRARSAARRSEAEAEGFALVFKAIVSSQRATCASAACRACSASRAAALARLAEATAVAADTFPLYVPLGRTCLSPEALGPERSQLAGAGSVSVRDLLRLSPLLVCPVRSVRLPSLSLK